MMENTFPPLIGGLTIGIAVSIMLLMTGRVTGISGIIGAALKFTKGDFLWRFTFLLGLLSGGFVLKIFNPHVFDDQSGRTTFMVTIAGLLVGFGTALGTGCTSGHGICGMARFSPRSIVATILFMISGIITSTLVGIYLRS